MQFVSEDFTVATIRRTTDLFLHLDLILPFGTQGYMQGTLIAQDREPDEVPHLSGDTVLYSKVEAK